MTRSLGASQTPRMSTESASARVAGQPARARLQRSLGPGTALSQAGVAEEYGVSRIPVRDALQRLATEGLVELRGSTAVVTPLSIEDLQELYEMREAVEPVATRLAVPRVGRAGIARMTRLLGVMDDPVVAARHWVETNAAFHAEVYTLAGRPRMIALVEQLRRLTDRYVYFHLDVVGRPGTSRTSTGRSSTRCGPRTPRRPPSSPTLTSRPPTRSCSTTCSPRSSANAPPSPRTGRCLPAQSPACAASPRPPRRPRPRSASGAAPPATRRPPPPRRTSSRCARPPS